MVEFEHGAQERLKQAIATEKPAINPIFMVAGCESGWIEFFVYYDPNPQDRPAEDIRAAIRPQLESLDEQHGRECSTDHDYYLVVRRINEERQTDVDDEVPMLLRKLSDFIESGGTLG